MEAFDLRTLVCVSLALASAGSLYGGYRLLSAGAGEPLHNAEPVAFFAGFGVLFALLVVMMTVGPWRAREAGVFPMHVLDLSAPPAAIERVKPGPASSLSIGATPIGSTRDTALPDSRREQDRQSDHLQ